MRCTKSPEASPPCAVTIAGELGSAGGLSGRIGGGSLDAFDRHRIHHGVARLHLGGVGGARQFSCLAGGPVCPVRCDVGGPSRQHRVDGVGFLSAVSPASRPQHSSGTPKARLLEKSK